jgi:hypothetical protein
MKTIIAKAELHLPGSRNGFPKDSRIALPDEQAAGLVEAGMAVYADPPPAPPAAEDAAGAEDARA